MESINNKSLILIDEQLDFISGSLAVEGSEAIIPITNELTRAFGKSGLPIATTQDWHPKSTAHFADEPNYTNTWPVHCVAGSTGAELHPGLDVAKHNGLATRFLKGVEPCASPEDDTSYSGALAKNPETGSTLPDWLNAHRVDKVYLAGLALGDGDKNKLCVDSTATDLQDLGYEVALVTDATEAVLPENRTKCLKNLGERGIRLMTLVEVLEEIRDEK